MNSLNPNLRKLTVTAGILAALLLLAVSIVGNIYQFVQGRSAGSKLEAAETRIDTLETRNTGLESENDDLNSRLTDAQTSLAQAQDDAESYQGQLETAQDQLDKVMCNYQIHQYDLYDVGSNDELIRPIMDVVRQAYDLTPIRTTYDTFWSKSKSAYFELTDSNHTSAVVVATWDLDMLQINGIYDVASACMLYVP